MNRSLLLRAFLSAALCSTFASAHSESLKPLFAHELPNVSGKSLTAVEVDFAPAAEADPHRHGQAFVYAYVLSGQIRSQLAGEPARTYRAGESWFEPPGADHVLTQNVSSKLPARLLVVFVADTGAPLKLPEPEKNPHPTPMAAPAVAHTSVPMPDQPGLAASAAPKAFPPAFKVEELKIGDATYYVRVGGDGPAVLMLHGFGDTGDMWEPLAQQMVRDHTVIVPDLRGMGLSSHPAQGYEKKAQGADMGQVLDRLHVGKVELVTHDIGNMVGYALAAEAPGRVTKWVAMDAPLPGLGTWDDQLKNPKTWHFNFTSPDDERLVEGRERIFLDRFYDELSADPKRIDEQTRRHYAALYARPHAMHDALQQFAAFPMDAIDNQAFAATVGKLKMPVLAIGGDQSYGASLASEIGSAASDVKGQVIAHSGHWLMEEQPAATIAAITTFLAQP